jgi:capsular exopolysaccharide synthesis family protein
MNNLRIGHFDPLEYSCSEALNTLCTNLTFAGDDMRKILITSCREGEGKSFMSMNLMRSLASIGKRVVLVDADLRRSALVSQYGIETEGKPRGLSYYLANMCGIDDLVYKTDIPGAFMVLGGRDAASSLRLLSRPRLPLLLNALAKSFDIVLIDSAPIGVIIDAAEVAKSCDGVLMVVSDKTVTRRELSEAIVQLQNTGATMIGTVLNKVSFESRSSKNYYHRAYYSHYRGGYYGGYYAGGASEPKRRGLLGLWRRRKDGPKGTYRSKDG